VAVPTEATGDVMAICRSKAGNNVLFFRDVDIGEYGGMVNERS